MRDHLLNLLLAAMVALSLYLSVQVALPPQVRSAPPDGTVPSVQSQPPGSARQMPEALRPERILLRNESGAVATIQAGSSLYHKTWVEVRMLLGNFRPSSAAFPVEQMPERLLAAEWVRLKLPITMTVDEWSDEWGWRGLALRRGSIPIDQVTFYLGTPGAVYLEGPTGSLYYLGDLSEAEAGRLLGLFQQTEAALFLPYRPLNVEQFSGRAVVGLTVPQVTTVPLARVRRMDLDERAEEIRYFPDLSVIRQIDERNARSLTDGRRLLRLLSNGILEYRTADTSGTAPDLRRAVALAQDWVGSRGGWPQDLVLTRILREPGKAKLTFEHRSEGPFPIESAGGALQVHVSSQQVLYFERYPGFVEISFSAQRLPIIPPEEAAERAAKGVAALRFEPVRAMHLAYRIRPVSQGTDWELEPTWVILAGDQRIYVPAAVDAAEPPQVVR